MINNHVIARSADQQHEFIEQATGRLIAKVTYHEHQSPRPFRLEFEAWVPNVSTSWLADLTRVNTIVDEVYVNLIQ